MSDDVKERVAMAVRTECGCGLTYDGQLVFCDDRRLIGGNDAYGKPIFHEKCDCRMIAAAAQGAMRPGDEIDLGEFGTVVLVPKEPKPVLMAGYYAACKFGIYEARAFDAAEAIYRAMLAAVKETINVRNAE